ECLPRCADADGDGAPEFADCDGDLTNGCEVPVDDLSRLYYRDADGDGFGDPDDVKFACDPGVLPSGYVGNSLDCDDTSPLAYGGPDPAEEICDGRDNNCDGTVDEASAFDWVGDNCEDTARFGVCRPGTFSCTGGQKTCVANLEPTAE